MRRTAAPSTGPLSRLRSPVAPDSHDASRAGCRDSFQICPTRPIASPILRRSREHNPDRSRGNVRPRIRAWCCSPRVPRRTRKLVPLRHRHNPRELHVPGSAPGGGSPDVGARGEAVTGGLRTGTCRVELPTGARIELRHLEVRRSTSSMPRSRECPSKPKYGLREMRQQKLAHSSSHRRHGSRPGHSTVELVVVEVLNLRCHEVFGQSWRQRGQLAPRAHRHTANLPVMVSDEAARLPACLSASS